MRTLQPHCRHPPQSRTLGHAGLSAGLRGERIARKSRAKLISLALWVTRETRRVLRENLPLTDLIEVNRTIMQGLCPQPDEAT